MSYPPDDHMLRALAIDTQVDETRCIASAPIHDHLRTDQGGMRLGIIAVVVDVAAASLSLAALHPDRAATVTLAMQSRRAARCGPLVAEARIVRQGSKQIVSGIEVFDNAGADRTSPVASSLVCFQRLRFRGDHAALPELGAHPVRSSMAHPAATLDRHFLERAATRVIDADAGVIEIDNHDWVRNSFGTLNGGMVASVIELAGEHAARSVLGPDLVSADLDIHYVGQGGDGPIRSSATRLRVADDHCVSRVELRDAGNDDSLMAVGTVHACRLL